MANLIKLHQLQLNLHKFV